MKLLKKWSLDQEVLLNNLQVGRFIQPRLGKSSKRKRLKGIVNEIDDTKAEINVGRKSDIKLPSIKGINKEFEPISPFLERHIRLTEKDIDDEKDSIIDPISFKDDYLINSDEINNNFYEK